MYQNKNKRFALRRLILTASLLLACVVLMVGVTWARYRTELTPSYPQYTAREPGSISIWPSYSTSTAALTEENGDIAWTYYDGTGTMRFYISNSTSETDYSDDDLSVSIRLLGTLSATNAQVILSVSDGGSTSTWTATPVQITEGTPLFDSFGGGNAYVFLDDNGTELRWNLEGGTLSVLSVQLDVLNLEQIEDAVLLQLQVIGN